MNFWVGLHRFAWVAAVAVVLGFAVYFIAPQAEQMQQRRRQRADLEKAIQVQQHRISRLQENQYHLANDPAFVERVSREELGYAKPGEVVFRFADDEDPLSRAHRP